MRSRSCPHSGTPPAQAAGLLEWCATRHRGLANLFSVELWEWFSFYGMQGIVLLYMYFEVTEGGLGMDRAVAAGIVGAYGGSVYLCSVLGGWVADRLFGSERTMLGSAVLIMLGHIALAVVPAAVGLATGLILVAIGSGGLKATITNLVGSLYEEKDPRRDAGFSIFYMGINIGGLVGPLLTGIVQQRWGFHLGFGLAAAVLFTVLLTSKHVEGDERSRVVSFIPMFIGSAAFWALFQQQFTVITIYSDERLDRMLGGWEIRIPWVQSFNPLFIILLATTGELMLSPVGLSLTTRLAPTAFPVLMVALFYLSVALGTALSGSLAALDSAETERAYCGTLGAVTIGIGVVLLVLARPIARLMRGVR